MTRHNCRDHEPCEGCTVGMRCDLHDIPKNSPTVGFEPTGRRPTSSTSRTPTERPSVPDGPDSGHVGESPIINDDLVEAAGGEQNVPRYLQMEAEQRERDFADDCGYPFATHMHPTESGKGKTWACPASACALERAGAARCTPELVEVENPTVAYRPGHDDCIATIPHFHDRLYQLGDWAASVTAKENDMDNTALAVLGEMLTEAEAALSRTTTNGGRFVRRLDFGEHEQASARVRALREARDRIAAQTT